MEIGDKGSKEKRNSEQGAQKQNKNKKKKENGADFQNYNYSSEKTERR